MLAWNNTNNSDKLWGIVCLVKGETFWDPSHYLIFWGKRGKKLSYQVRTINESQAKMLFETKLDRQYKKVQEQDFEQVCPGITDEIERMLIWERIKL